MYMYAQGNLSQLHILVQFYTMISAIAFYDSSKTAHCCYLTKTHKQNMHRFQCNINKALRNVVYFGVWNVSKITLTSLVFILSTPLIRMKSYTKCLIAIAEITKVSYTNHTCNCQRTDLAILMPSLRFSSAQAFLFWIVPASDHNIYFTFLKFIFSVNSAAEFTSIVYKRQFSSKNCKILLYVSWGRGGLVVNTSDSGSRGWGFEPHSGRCVVSLSKTYLPPKSTGNTQEAGSVQHDWNIVYRDVKQQTKQTNLFFIPEVFIIFIKKKHAFLWFCQLHSYIS